ncbi:MAG: S41 family peptidase [Flammeovirgaceae bacterium]
MTNLHAYLRITFSFLFACCVGKLCGQSASETHQPIKNFEHLWKTFDERYANFQLKQINWQKIYEQYRPMVHEQTTNQELFEICCKMLQALHDGHVTLQTDFDGEEKFCGPPYTFKLEDEFPSKKDQDNLTQVILTELQKQGFSKPIPIPLNDEIHVQYAVSERYGYFRIDDMEGFFPGLLNRALDQSMQAFEGKQGLIIDLRFNGGGWDFISYQIAGRFTQEQIVGHYKQTRKKGTNTFKKMKTWWLKPKGDIQFTSPVVVLTSDFTASAAEVFLLAMKQLPQVLLVGDTTEGIFSDMYEFRLPNGWRASLSHQQFFSANMVNYEGKGIKPDYPVINTKQDLQSQHDPVIQKAIAVLNEKAEK